MKQGQYASDHFDVIVVGAGNAALCAALSAAEGGAKVVVVERAPEAARGGNSAFTGGAFRVAYDGVDDIALLVPDLTADERRTSDFGSYTRERFFDDLMSMSGNRADMPLVETLVEDSLPTLQWMQSHGVRFIPIYGRQAFRIDGQYRFWGGLTVEVSGGGLALVNALFASAKKHGVAIRYGCQAHGLVVEDGQICGIDVVCDGRQARIRGRAVILASGGFHANAAWRAGYLGPGWDLAKVRGSRYNTGDGLRMARKAGARTAGHWSGCHSVFFDANAPAFGDIELLNQQKNYFTLGIVVNALGERFIDEGEDFRNYTYSRMGAELLKQPGARGWQLFDARTAALLPDEYRVRHATREQADTLASLIAKLDGVDRERLASTIEAFNASVQRDIPFDPSVKDGRCTRGLPIDKSNWAMPLEQGPFVAFEVTCGITCTYGGIAINAEGEVLSEAGPAVPGLYAAGEMVGGLYYGKYPGGAGLTSGSVFGRRAGRHAARFAVP
ncbi:FAD-dependent tricarballylate dehydrogenase TcuA [Cupriavidus sp. CP313]